MQRWKNESGRCKIHMWDFKGRNEYSREGGIIHYQKRSRIQFY